ncbi:hypothetical protein MNB_SUP05-SYMBIONT-5-1126 [hydrothermal vent metagenome]|uniref:Uncharacterized protein n=1 Tax=hydrothermal vent metagenome TaxID=652676 RepID=A0A1W1E5V0_9ZZZZ
MRRKFGKGVKNFHKGVKKFGKGVKKSYKGVRKSGTAFKTSNGAECFSRLPQSTTQKIRQKNKIPYKSNTYDF